MPVKNIKINKLTTIVFALLIMLSVGVCLAFASYGGAEVALAANDNTGSTAVDAEISTYQEKLDTGASITLKATARETTYAPDAAIAIAEAREQAVITLSGDLWKAVESGRITATLYASGTNSYSTNSGTPGAKDAGFTVSGAMSGNGKFSTANTTYEDRVIAEEVLLDADNGNEIIIEYYATHRAIDEKTTLGENIAEASVDCVMNFTLELSFEEVVVIMHSSSGGSVKDAEGNILEMVEGEKQLTLGFGESIAFTAVPKDGCFFLGWKNENSNQSNVLGMTLDLGKTVDIPSGEVPNYTAEFQYITVASQDEYEYTGSPVGPVVRSTAYTGIYYLIHRYTGTTLSGETIDVMSEGAQDIVAAPIRTGSFNYTCEFYYRVGNANNYTKGEYIGGISIDFETKKNTPVVTRKNDNSSTITLSFGDNLSALDLSYEATNSIDTLVTLTGTLEIYLGENRVDVNSLLPMSNEGTDYTLRFTPNDLNNYNVLDSALKIYVKDDITDIGVNLEQGNRDYTISKSIATASDVDNDVQNNYSTLEVPDNGELVKVALRATMNDVSGQYFFIGWRIGLSQDGSFTANSYVYKYLNYAKVNRDANGDITSIDGLAYDYYLPHYSKLSDEERAKYTHAKFEAVFIKDITCIDNPDTLTIPYSGSRGYTLVEFSPSTGYQIGAGELLYYYANAPENGVNDAPYSIGEHKLKYDIMVDDAVVDVRVINYNVTIGNLSVKINESESIKNGGYDRASGWARRMYYNLKVDNLLSGGAEAYYYSTDNGGTWTKIDGTIESGSECKMSFVTPEVVNDTQVRSYIFIATHEANGMPMVFGDKTYNVVAGAATHTLVKIDTVEPTLTNVTETTALNGAWTMSSVDFEALASFGGSGAVIDVCYVDKSSSFIKVDSNIALNNGESEINTENETVSFKLDTQYSGKVKIRIRTGSGLTYEVPTEFDVNVDLTAPIFSATEKNHTANTAQGWIGLATEVSFTIDNVGGSPLLEPFATDEDGQYVEITNVTDNKYCLTISDSRVYKVVAKDEAGNVNEILIQEKIDVETVQHQYNAESYQAGNWAKIGSKVMFDMNMGASGARLRASVDGGDYIPVTEFVGSQFGMVKANFTLEYEIPYSEQVKTYNFQIETGTGAIINVAFGEVKFDIEAPVYTLETDLSEWQGAKWTSTAIVATFIAVDNQGSVNSGIKEVSVDNGGKIVDLGNNRYELKIDKCTDFTITIMDKAGNTIQEVVRANVDILTPTLLLTAYVGGGNPQNVEEELTDEDRANVYDFNSWITKANAEPWVRIDFTIQQLTPSGAKIEYSIDNGATWKVLTPTFTLASGELSGEVSTSVYFDTEQNRKYAFRLVTGSQREVRYNAPDGEDLFIRIDFTAPTLRSEVFRVGNNANFDLKNVWVNQDGQYWIMLQDTLAGSGANPQSIILKEYALDVSDDSILDGTAVPTERTMSKSGDYFVYDMTEAKKYQLYFEDYAGNAYEGDIFVPHIDKTSGFSLSIKATKYTPSGSNDAGNPLTDSDWLNANEYVIFEGTSTFTQGSGFGPSGGELQFSIDGGNTYQSAKNINGEDVQVTPTTTNKYEIKTSAEQYYTYKFRLVTGAGVEYVFDKEYTVKKDNTTPSISTILAYADGQAYAGEWTKNNLRFTINVSAGVSGGAVYYGVGASKEEAVWTSLIELPKNTVQANTYYYTVDSSANTNYYFKVVSSRPDVETISASEHVVKLDNTQIDASVRAHKEGGDAVVSGSWVHTTTFVVLDVKLIGESGIDTIWVKSDSGLGYGEYVESSDSFILQENTSALTKYVFKVISVSGMEQETEEFVIGYDDVTPEFNYDVVGNKLPSGNLYQDWYVSDIDVSIRLTNQIASGHQIYYSYRENVANAEYSEWMLASDNFVLSDNGVQGGLDRYYKFKAVTGSGLEVEKEERYLPIDTYDYEVKADLYVGNVESDEAHEYAEVVGAGIYHRGDSVTVSITPNATYTIRTIKEIKGESEQVLFNLSYEASFTSTETMVYTIGNAPISLEVGFYKEVTIEYGMAIDDGVVVDNTALLRQCLQEGDVVEVPFKAEEDDFDIFFGTLREKVNRTYVKGENIFDRANAIKEIGEYEINVESLDENYVIMNGSERMVVVYFVNEGTILNPYLINNLKDFYYIDEYMHYEDGYESLDERAYLGENRRNAYFKQVADIVFTEAEANAFTPNGDKGEGYTNEFKGTYDGDGYEFVYGGTFVTKSDFGLFLNVSLGSSIKNLGVRYSVRVEDVEDVTVGLVVANSVTGGISSVYAIGNVYVAGSTGVKVGGIVGSLTAGSLVSVSFADVSITITPLVEGGVLKASSGYFGGMVGYANGAYTAKVYTVSRITLTDSEKYSITAPSGTDFAYAGAVVGYMENLEAAGNTPQSGNESYYLENNVSYDGSIERGLSLGNRDTFGQYNSLRHASANIDFFAGSLEGTASNVKIVKEVTVKQLVNVRINGIKEQVGMMGDGTTENPFLVDSQAKLAYVETFPWAVFKQTVDISLTTDNNGKVVFADKVPFVGVYDGDNHSIICANVESDTTAYGGLFGVVSGTIKNLKVINASYLYGGENELYVGGLVGVLEGGSVQNVVVTGTIEVDSTAKVIYAGGIVGVMIGGNIDNSISMVNVTALGVNVVVGGVVAQVQGNANIQNVVNLSTISAHYDEKANVGATLGNVNSEEARLQNVYHLLQNAYANDKGISSAIGYDVGARVSDVVAKTHQGIMETSVAIGVVQDIVGALYPFEGTGTKADPFQIDSYEKLELVGNYMYANFVLTDNIVIGDLNDDGKLDSADGYDYNFEVIGKGATFTGSLDGDGYSILGLSDSLFAVNSGAVSDITLNLNYKVYAKESDIPESDKVINAETGVEYTSSKVAGKGEDIVFGALAKVNTATGSLIRVTVTGDIYVRTSGSTKVTLGGFVGVDMGGQIVASQISAKVSVRASQMVVGGIIGEIKYSDRALNQITTNYVLVTDNLDLGGGTAIAGSFIGRIGVSTNYEPDYASSTEVIVNGTSLGNERYVGLSK